MGILKLIGFRVKFMKDLVIREALDKDVNGIIEVLKSIYLQDEVWAGRALKNLLATENYCYFYRHSRVSVKDSK